MAENSVTPAKAPLQPPSRADSGGVAAVTLWPSEVPKAGVLLSFLNDPKVAPEPYRSIASRLLASLQFPERAAVYTASPSAEEALVQKMVVTRFRLVAAVETRAEQSTPDAVALDELVQEVDEALAAVNQLTATTQDPELKEVCAASRTVFAKGVQELLPIATEAHQRIGYTAPKPVVRITSSKHEAVTKPVSRTKLLVGLLGVCVLLAVGATFLFSNSVKPVPPLPSLPPNTEVFGDFASGAVAVRSKDGKPIDPKEVQRFSNEAMAIGAVVEEASPDMLTVTPR